MEIFVQWLDDFEDFIVVLLAAWERLRLRCLQAGFVAAVVLLAIQIANVGKAFAPTFAVAALGSVGIWFAALLYSQFLTNQHGAAPASNRLNA